MDNGPHLSRWHMVPGVPLDKAQTFLSRRLKLLARPLKCACVSAVLATLAITKRPEEVTPINLAFLLVERRSRFKGSFSSVLISSFILCDLALVRFQEIIFEVSKNNSESFGAGSAQSTLQQRLHLQSMPVRLVIGAKNDTWPNCVISSSFASIFTLFESQIRCIILYTIRDVQVTFKS